MRIDRHILAELESRAWDNAQAAAEAREAAQWKPPCDCMLGTCESKPTGCRMADEVKSGSGVQ